MINKKIAPHYDMQELNRRTINYAVSKIKAGMTLSELRNVCEHFMLRNGADSFWYYNIGAFIFSGDETAVSISGRKYKTSDKRIKENDIITIDLSPQKNKIWGDYARTIVLENGKVVNNISEIKNTEWKNGLQIEASLHRELINFVNINTTFEELYTHINQRISESGYINLDFLGNLGHSIEKSKIKRKYIEKGNSKRLSDMQLFTFEPHISTPDSKYGYKMENIYYFENGKLMEL